MGTITPRLKLFKPNSSDPVDVDVLFAAFDKLDLTTGIITYDDETQITAIPTEDRFEGMYVKSRATGKKYIYDSELSAFVLDYVVSSTPLTITGTGPVVFGKQAIRQYTFGATNGYQAPGVIVSADTEVNLGTEIGLNIFPNIRTTEVGQKVLIEFTALVGIVESPTGTKVSSYGSPAWTNDVLPDIEFALIDVLTPVGVIAVAAAESPGGNQRSAEIYGRMFISPDVGLHDYYIKATTRNQQIDGTPGTGEYLSILSSTLTASLVTSVV